MPCMFISRLSYHVQIYRLKNSSSSFENIYFIQCYLLRYKGWNCHAFQADFPEKGFDFHVLSPLMTKEAQQIAGQSQMLPGHAKGFSLAETHWPGPWLKLWPIASLVLASNCSKCPRQIYIMTWLQNAYLKRLQRKQFTLYKHQFSHLKTIS